jgi:hypothetical protein
MVHAKAVVVGGLAALASLVLGTPVAANSPKPIFSQPSLYCNFGVATSVNSSGGRESVGFASTCNGDNSYSGSLSDTVANGVAVSVWHKSINGSTVYVRNALTTPTMSGVSYGLTDNNSSTVFKLCVGSAEGNCNTPLINNGF